MLNSGWQCPPLNLVTIKFGLRCTKLMLNSKIIQNKQENIPNSVKKYPCQKYKSLQFEPLIQVCIFYQFRWQIWSWDLIFIKVLSFHHHYNVQTIKSSQITFLNSMGFPDSSSDERIWFGLFTSYLRYLHLGPFSVIKYTKIKLQWYKEKKIPTIYKHKLLAALKFSYSSFSSCLHF